MLYTQNEKYWAKRPITDAKVDWNYSEADWIQGYMKSVNHPHRQVILDALEILEPFESLIEVGCSTGPNLYCIGTKYNEVKLHGIDINPHVVAEAQKWKKRNTKIYLGSISKIDAPDKSYDILLSDAVMLYVGKVSIRKVLNEFERVTKKGMIFVEWFDESLQGVIKDFHWARNYPKLLEEIGFKTVCHRKLTKEEWPTPKWYKHGCITVARKV